MDKIIKNSFLGELFKYTETSITNFYNKLLNTQLNIISVTSIILFMWVYAVFNSGLDFLNEAMFSSAIILLTLITKTLK